MTTLVHLFSGGWNYVFAFFALIAAGVAAYFGGKSKGQTEEKAKVSIKDYNFHDRYRIFSWYKLCNLHRFAEQMKRGLALFFHI